MEICSSFVTKYTNNWFENKLMGENFMNLR